MVPGGLPFGQEHCARTGMPSGSRLHLADNITRQAQSHPPIC
jgi:hypothetical protein